MNGVLQRRAPSESMSQRHVPRVSAPRPAVNSTNELVHRFLLIGKTHPHALPAAATIAPTASRPTSRSLSDRSLRIHRPAMTPNSVVAMAGTVESGPSGSHVMLCAHMWFPPPQLL